MNYFERDPKNHESLPDACTGYLVHPFGKSLCWLLGTSVQEIGPVVHDGASFLAKVGEIRV
jgi:hypothetical protein